MDDDDDDEDGGDDGHGNGNLILFTLSGLLQKDLSTNRVETTNQQKKIISKKGICQNHGKAFHCTFFLPSSVRLQRTIFPILPPSNLLTWEPWEVVPGLRSVQCAVCSAQCAVWRSNQGLANHRPRL